MAGRDTQYGHQVFLRGGRSGLIQDCSIARGNPADAAMFPALLNRQAAVFQRPLRQLAADGGSQTVLAALALSHLAAAYQAGQIICLSNRREKIP